MNLFRIFLVESFILLQSFRDGVTLVIAIITLNCLLHLLQEHHLTRRLAFTNSLRIRQDCENRSADDWCWETFLPLLFRREPPRGDFDWKPGIDRDCVHVCSSGG